MKIEINCPHGEYKDGMKIHCKITGRWCGNQYFKQCKGWWTLNDRAKDCPLRNRSFE